jgi:hypothetical protein
MWVIVGQILNFGRFIISQIPNKKIAGKSNKKKKYTEFYTYRWNFQYYSIILVGHHHF